MSVPPGSTIGILGGGQLGRMLAIAAANLGYRTHIYAPGMSGPASEVSARWTHGAYDDKAAVAAFASQVDVVTYEFENVDTSGLRCLFQAQRQFRRAGRQLVLSGLPAGLERILLLVSSQVLAQAVEDPRNSLTL